MHDVPQHFGRFELDIAAAIVDQLGAFLEQLRAEPLSASEILDGLPREPGVYRLFHHGERVYVGKADSLRDRLSQHARDIDGRVGISRSELSFVCAALSKNWAPFGAEELLIRATQHSWQNSGFGNNDPGRNRDHSELHDDHWDRRFPINIEHRCIEIRRGEYMAFDLLNALKAKVPFLLRFERTPAARAELEVAAVTIAADAPTFWEAISSVVRSLPGWQATALPGYCIFYKERTSYSQAIREVRG